MSTFQLLLFIIAGSIFYLFFRQLFSGNHPKRGVDFEAKRANEQIGGVNRPDKTFSRPTHEPSRLDQLLGMAEQAIEKGDLLEAKKALQSALILDETHYEVLQKSGYVFMQIEEYERAKGYFEQCLEQDETDDTTHAWLASTLHQLGEDEASLQHYERAIAIDESYAPYHFNYANTLNTLNRTQEALVHYKKAYALDSSLVEAQEMIAKLSEV